MKDIHGNAYARVDDLKAGDQVKTDSGFTCLKEGEVLEVKQDGDSLYIDCKDGKHFLIGQIAQSGEDFYYSGLYPIDKPE